MNKIKYMLLAVLFLGAMQSCDYFELDNIEPTDSVSPANSITDRQSAQAAVAGVYDELQDPTLAFDGYLSLWQYFSDECVFTGTFPTRLEFGNFNVFPANTTMAGVFSDFYDVINVANNLIDVIPTVDDISLQDPAVVNNFLAEARFARALSYLHLTLGWGDVPLITTPTRGVGEELNVPTNPAADVQRQVQEDLEFAAANLNGGSLEFTPEAANALLARLALYQGRWADAITLAEGVLGAGFDLTAEAYLSDVILQIRFNATDGNSNAFFYGPAELNGRLSISPSQTLIDAYEPGDIRKDLSVDETTVPGTPFGIKYDDFGAAGGSQTDPLLFVRKAELCLILAEAYAEQGDFTSANGWYNQVRNRAGLPDGTLDASNYVDLILQERFVELAMEGGHRLWDLRRRGRALDVLGPLGYQACDNVWPLPQRDIDRNPNLQQNGCCNC